MYRMQKQRAGMYHLDLSLTKCRRNLDGWARAGAKRLFIGILGSNFDERPFGILSIGRRSFKNTALLYCPIGQWLGVF